MRRISQKEVIGFLLITILASGAIYIAFDGEGVKMRIDDDKSTFYVLDDSRWKKAGIEYNSMWLGSKKLYRDKKSIEILTHFDKDNNITKIQRYVSYKTTKEKKPVVVDTYIFDGNIEDVELFPISHTVQIINGSDFIYQYEVRELKYDGQTIKNVKSPQKFGLNMKVEWDEEKSYWNTLYKSGILKVRYRPETDDELYSVRLFDPPTTISDCHDLNTPYTTYVMDTDVTGSDAGHCMNITANNVILDCDGHRIEAVANNNNFAGINVTRGSRQDVNVSIRNCILHGWAGTGGKCVFGDSMAESGAIILNKVDGIYLNNLTMNYSSSGIVLGDSGMVIGDNLTYSNSKAGTVGGAGIGFIYFCVDENNDIVCDNCDNFLFTNINSSGPAEGQFHTDGSGLMIAQENDASESDYISNFTLIDAVFQSNEDYGFYLKKVKNSKFENVNVTSVGVDGAYLYVLTNVNFTNVNITGSTSEGVYTATNMNDVKIEDSYIGQSGAEGIEHRIYFGTGFRVEDTVIADSTTHGVYMTQDRQAGDAEILFNNVTFRGNTNYGINADGITGFNITNCTFIENEYGFVIDDSEGRDNEGNIYNNLFNQTNNDIMVKTPGRTWEIFGNTSLQERSPITGAGLFFGGNFYTNITGNGYSDTCEPGIYYGICGSSRDMSNGTGKFIDYLPLSSGATYIVLPANLSIPADSDTIYNNTGDGIVVFNWSHIQNQSNLLYNLTLNGTLRCHAVSDLNCSNSSGLKTGNYMWNITSYNDVNSSVSKNFYFDVDKTELNYSLCCFTDALAYRPNLSNFNYTHSNLTQYNVNISNFSLCNYTYIFNLTASAAVDLQGQLNTSLIPSYTLNANGVSMTPSWTNIFSAITTGTYYINLSVDYINATQSQDNWTIDFRVS